MALQGTKALEAWCRSVTAGYQGVNILNMTTSWRSGLGFCAIIHHHCPDLLDYSALDPDDVFGNNELAFQVAEQHLGIPALLDPRDMVECELLDRLSILTYLSQYYQAFHGQGVQNRIRHVGSMSKSSSANSDLGDVTRSRNVPTIGRSSDPCRVCSKAVFILERLNVGGRILHRTCFKCARCETQLSLAGYYETESGEYCCELCPDEEQAGTIRPNVALGKLLPENVEDVDSGHSSEDSSDEDQEAGHEEEEGEEGDRTEDPETNDESFTSGYVEEVGQTPAQCAADIPVDLQDEATSCGSVEAPAVHRADVELTTTVAPEDTKAEAKAVPLNPFDEDEEDDEKEEEEVVSVSHHKSEPSQPLPTLYLSPAAEGSSNEKEEEENATFGQQKVKASLNPFGSDSEDEEHNNRAGTTISTLAGQDQDKSRSASLNPFGSDLSSDDDCSRGSVSPSPSARGSTTRLRKKRRAPPPPPGSKPGTPKGVVVSASSGRPVPAPRPSRDSLAGTTPARHSVPPPSTTASAEAAKRLKDENNMNRRSQILESLNRGEYGGSRPDLPANRMLRSDTSLSSSHTQCDSAASSASQSETVSLMSVSTTTTHSSIDQPGSTFPSQSFAPLAADKSDEGQWRKKKGPAPPRPIPPRRTVKKLHRKVINQELEDIEVKQNELERQGVRLEKTIREICDKNDAEEGADRDSLGPEAEDLIIQLFDLVNEKNELFRRQTELIYMKKENRLEEQHADLEHQIRVLMAKPEHQRTEEDRTREEKLIARLVQVVGLRNEIVDCLEMDRLRELDEDTAIEDHMSNYAAVKPVETKKMFPKILKIKKKKKKNRENEKDIDTSELGGGEAEEQPDTKEKKKPSAKKKLLSYASKKLAFPHS